MIVMIFVVIVVVVVPFLPTFQHEIDDFRRVSVDDGFDQFFRCLNVFRRPLLLLLLLLLAGVVLLGRRVLRKAA